MTPGRISQFDLALLPEDAVEVVEDVALAPGRTAVGDERVEEHAVGQPLDELGLAWAPHAQEGGLVKGDVGRRVDADDGEAGTVALQNSDH